MTGGTCTTVNGRASICTWDLRAVFLTKKQAADAVKQLLDEDIDFNVEFSTELESTRTVYVVDIVDMPWAANLSTAAKILESVDHDGH